MTLQFPNEISWPLAVFVISTSSDFVNTYLLFIELVSKKLNHFGMIAGLFQQIGSHSSRFVLFWKLFTIRMLKSVKVFAFSFWKLMRKNNCFIEIKLLALCCKMAAKCYNSLDTNFNMQSTMLIIVGIHTKKYFSSTL